VSQFQPGLSFLLNNEDPKHQYAAVPDIGGFAIAGINSASWPSDYAKIAALPQSQRTQAVSDFYQFNFWNKMQIGGLVSQDVANRVLDMGVNAGAITGIKILQKALWALGCSGIIIDGILGTITIEAANSFDSDRLLASFRQTRLAYYQKIVDNNPQDQKYFTGWEARALA
jgi:lysozyme family protein